MLSKAFLRRCPYAAYRLGWLYNEGLGVERNPQKAWEYYQQAVSMQYADAMTDVGIFTGMVFLWRKIMQKLWII